MKPTVTLCIATYKRPSGLRRLLKSLASINFDGTLNIVVVDNDATNQEGIAVCKELETTKYRWQLLYATEEKTGISYTRNTGVNKAIAETNPEFIAFLDDDEFVDPKWLEELLRVQMEFKADVVSGRPIPHFDEIPPKWISETDLYSVKRLPEGLIAVATSTANILAKASAIKEFLPEMFSPRFAQSGGSDADLFLRMKSQGYSFAWADDAISYEVIPASRATKKWLRKRAYRIGNTNVIIQRCYSPGLVNELWRLTKTAGLLTLSGIYFLLTYPSEIHRLKSSIMFYKGLGKIKGHCGKLYLEYKVTHGN